MTAKERKEISKDTPVLLVEYKKSFMGFESGRCARCGKGLGRDARDKDSFRYCPKCGQRFCGEGEEDE